ncbi:hypothetical protein SMIDD26_01365 [Streptococcus mitis]|uniref:Uncharacterized protein n=1 Tax=Streptococcus mitis TaxID=28037 RepID=A0A139PPC1_STRMT|nr:hypothetical protein SMIDD26_01365 [Streptococcus mitis]
MYVTRVPLFSFRIFKEIEGSQKVFGLQYCFRYSISPSII